MVNFSYLSRISEGYQVIALAHKSLNIENCDTVCIKTVVMTSDNMLTALSVAKDCDIVKPGTSVIDESVESDGSHRFISHRAIVNYHHLTK
ncbi:hypothetical protein ALC56_04841 [Trachymyrmex septentrionalis]|uniref:Uncharacterized protein n=1 Tax=Trachymyrmex septentrionalis TaxID=34720 RepID=A0A195FJU7_9HYME|nr:hypothetical protein ALC56_04841 [Trachymyrmex septentrionalis]